MTTTRLAGSKLVLICGFVASAACAACSSTGASDQTGRTPSSSGASAIAGSGGAGSPATGGSVSGTAGGGASGGGTGGQPAGAAGMGGAGASAGSAGSGGGAQGGGGGMGGAPSGLNYNGAIFYVTRADGTLFAFQTGTWEQVGKWTGLPITDGIRGIDADPKTGNLYFTHGGAGPKSFGTVLTKNGSLAAWNLYTNKLVYDKKLEHGVDQPSYGNDLVYVPAGEFTDVRDWVYYRASDGAKLGTEPGGMNPHDTIYKNGHRYYGGTEDTFLYVIGINGVPKVGPSPSGTAGVRPFTVNGSETRAYITWSNYRGFSVGDLTTGKIIKSISFGGDPCHIAPSHGMTLSPDNKEVYVLDTCINQVKVYTATDDPQLVAAIPFEHNIRPGDENPCAWDCAKDGWLMHSRDGKYVYIGDSGDIVDTATHKMAHYLPELANCRHGFLEMIWKDGYIVDTSTHVGLGY